MLCILYDYYKIFIYPSSGVIGTCDAISRMTKTHTVEITKSTIKQILATSTPALSNITAMPLIENIHNNFINGTTTVLTDKINKTIIGN